MSTFTEEIPLLPPKPPSEQTNNETATSQHDTATKPTHGYALWVSICFALNYSIGAGILGMPYEFYKTGYLLSSIIIAIMGVLSYITNIYVVDAMIRAEAITSICTQSESLAIQRSQIISNTLLVKQTLTNQSITAQEIRDNYNLQRNEYQLSELIGIFCGKYHRIAYDFTFGLSTIIALWSYNVLFAVSLSRNFGISFISSSCNMELYASNQHNECRILYSMYVVIFWIWTLIITLIDFKHQKWLQVSATIARIVIIVLMVFTCIGLMYSVYIYDGSAYIIGAWSGKDAVIWQSSGIAYTIAVAAFAFGSQFCVMDVIDPLSTHNKQTKQHLLWASSVAICGVVYILCGVTISLYFGGNTQSPCTLAWEGFMGFSAANIAPVWALIVSSIVVLLPAIDIGSAFPLIATTLANTFEALLLSLLSDSKKNVREITTCYESCYNQRYVVIIKITLCTLVSGIALLEWNFELILALSGAFKLLAVYVAPCYLEWKSRQFIKDICIDDDDNIADTFTSKQWIAHNVWLVIISSISVIAFVAIFVSIVGYM